MSHKGSVDVTSRVFMFVGFSEWALWSALLHVVGLGLKYLVVSHTWLYVGISRSFILSIGESLLCSSAGEKCIKNTSSLPTLEVSLARLWLFSRLRRAASIP